jgi:hypothetical protein
VNDLFEETHEVAGGDHDRRLTSDVSTLAITLHSVAMMRTPPMRRIRLASDRLREGRTSTHGRR